MNFNCLDAKARFSDVQSSNGWNLDNGISGAIGN